MLMRLNIIDLISDFHSNPNILHMRKLNLPYYLIIAQ